MASKARKVPKGFNPKSYERPGLTVHNFYILSIGRRNFRNKRSF